MAVTRKAAGFSLIEVVISMTILAVGLLGFISLYGTGFKALKGSSVRTTALRLAQDKMETLRHERPGHITEAHYTKGEDPGKGLLISWSRVPSEENDNIWLISVEVTWTNQEGQSKKVVLKSFRSN